ncbi:MAG: YdiU family protein [Hydrogenovibrio sp.]|uniref:protein adenylyltransferase SelO n=1 Tax=Hydrogenovibrio sp. TaxID=2065821 RepID=UPI0028709A81|nr:YdiU family protein [Hydrogenovibrio sp.]MDR9498845.1 YdiU family protein [Hydrogenovibrio sp.]
MPFQSRFTQLPSDFYQFNAPEPMQDAHLVAVNEALRAQLGLTLNDEALLALTSGQLAHPQLAELGLRPLAQKYTGHQFGYYNPHLGDGRGVLLGEWQAPDGKVWDLHLKGAGRTRFSRNGDGRAVLRSSIREFLASEALYGLGVPTTRALAIATIDEMVQREILEPRATLLRLTPTHIRFGHFEWAARQSATARDALLGYVIDHYFPEAQGQSLKHQAWYFLHSVCQRTARLIAHWQAVGFNHGVMNSDNMSILGETFDFGPYAFFDDFQIGFVCNHSDTDGRYAYSEQPPIGHFNCALLADALGAYLSEEEQKKALESYVDEYNRVALAQMLVKLGLADSPKDRNQPEAEVQKGDRALVADVFIMMDQQRVDHSLFFRRLAWLGTEREPELMALLAEPDAFADWFESLQQRISEAGLSQTDWQARIRAANPSIVLRSYIAQEIIDAAEKGDYAPLTQWTQALQRPFDDHPELAEYQQPPKPAQKSMVLSCSS